jgi:hypothetical protein
MTSYRRVINLHLMTSPSPDGLPRYKCVATTNTHEPAVGAILTEDEVKEWLEKVARPSENLTINFR